MGVILWILAIGSGLSLLWFVVQLFALTFKRLFPYREAVVESISLGERKVPKSHQVYATVRFTCDGQSDLMTIPFWGTNRKRIERSRRYNRLKQFYEPGASFRIHHAPLGGITSFMPECPVLRFETAFVALCAWLCACILFGSVAALLIH